MRDTDYLIKIKNDTIYFFENILSSKELQEEYDISNCENRDFILKTINEFKNNPKAFIVKPFYELDYKNESCPRSIIVKRSEDRFISCKINGLDNKEEYYIEPFRFISILKQFVEDESIKRELYSENKKEKETVRER